MQINELLTEDDAVSPVIGVILMVAITVILAAVIAAFVLGLGNDAANQTPTAAFTFDYDQVDETNSGPSWGVVAVTHDGGDRILRDELFIRGTGFNRSGGPNEVGFTPGGSGSPTASEELGRYVSDEANEKVDHVAAGKWNGTASGQEDESTVVSGDRAVIYASSDFEITVNFQDREGTASTTLSGGRGPDAGN